MYAVIVRSHTDGKEVARYIFETLDEAYEAHRAVVSMRIVQNQERVSVALEEEPPLPKLKEKIARLGSLETVPTP